MVQDPHQISYDVKGQLENNILLILIFFKFHFSLMYTQLIEIPLFSRVNSLICTSLRLIIQYVPFKRLSILFAPL